MIDRRSRAVSLCATVCMVLTAACTTPQEHSAPPSSPTHGAAGIGDEYYPNAGNGGYDVEHYAVTVRYEPDSGRLTGDTTVRARTAQDLSRFNLDLRGFTVSSVEVDGRAAEFTREGDTELVITPAEPLGENAVFETRVRYEGEPIAADAGQLGGNGWYRTPSGGAFVLGEPESASYWFPVNEHPRDKATFELTSSVPKGWTAVSIGTSDKPVTEDGWTTTTWTEPDPVASYLTMFAVDRFDVQTGELADGTPLRNVFAPGTEDARDEAARTEEVVSFLASRFGDYPASTAGGIYLNSDTGFALETQGTPTYPSGPDIEVLVHELAHQWYGNSVSLRSWADVCLNECFASYATWLWQEKHGADLDALFREQVDQLGGDQDFWAQPLYDMGPGNEFGGVYTKGPLAVHALRMRVGDDAFGRLLREWPAQRGNGNASWQDFERFAEKLTGQDLTDFFAAWFHGTERPEAPHLHPKPHGR